VASLLFWTVSQLHLLGTQHKTITQLCCQALYRLSSKLLGKAAWGVAAFCF